MHAIETTTIDFVRALFDSVGWLGIVIAMAIESACIPLPSEVIMPLAGWLIVEQRGLGWPGLLEASLWAAIGNVIGSTIAYWVGALGGRPLLLRYGRWVLLTRADVDRADRYFERWGEVTAFVSRLLPVVRTFISLPAGMARMPFWRFTFYTFAGAFLWSLPLTWVGYHLGPEWEQFRSSAQVLDYPIALVVVLAVGWFVWHRVRELRHEARTH